MKLEILDVSKRYRRGVLALDKFSLELKPGVLGLLGPNSAGKTTLMGILATIKGYRRARPVERRRCGVRSGCAAIGAGLSAAGFWRVSEFERG